MKQPDTTHKIIIGAAQKMSGLKDESVDLYRDFAALPDD